MFSYIQKSIDIVAENSSDFVFDKNKFIRKGKFSFKHHLTFLCFNKGTSNQAELEDFVEDDFTKELETITRQAYSKQRIHIKPTTFKEISKQYLININYTKNNNFFKEFRGFRLLGGDGSDFEIPDFEEVRKEFGIKNTKKYRKPANAKFSSIRDLLNGFILDGILGNYKQGELPLIQQNIKNIENLINPEKTIFIFDRGYNAIELYTHNVH